jgi:hypothetical protein
MVRPWRHFTRISEAKRLSAGTMMLVPGFQGQACLFFFFQSKTRDCFKKKFPELKSFESPVRSHLPIKTECPAVKTD